MLDRADATCTPKLWGFGKQVYQALLTTLTDEEYMDALDVYKGVDVKVRYQKASGQTYPTTDLKFSRKDTPLAASDEEIQAILTKVPKVESVYQPVTKSQIKEQLQSWLAPSEDEVEEYSSEIVKGGVSADSVLEEDNTPAPSLDDVDAMFEEALSD